MTQTKTTLRIGYALDGDSRAWWTPYCADTADGQSVKVIQGIGGTMSESAAKKTAEDAADSARRSGYAVQWEGRQDCRA